jgi:hypothetical protein
VGSELPALGDHLPGAVGLLANKVVQITCVDIVGQFGNLLALPRQCSIYAMATTSSGISSANPAA